MNEEPVLEPLNALGSAPQASSPAERRSLPASVINLERVQRIHLGIDAEQMEFNGATLAAMLGDVACRCDEFDATILYSFANALLGKDDHHILALKKKRQGRYVSPHEFEGIHYRNKTWLHWLAHLEKQGVKTEAAIMTIAEAERASRATVFAGIRQAERFLDEGAQIFPGNENFRNPRLAKSTKS